MVLSFAGSVLFFFAVAVFGIPAMFVLAIALDRREAARMKRRREQRARQ